MKKKYSLFLDNPELTRNIWQEVSVQRLIAVPAIWVIVILLFMVFHTDGLDWQFLVRGSVVIYIFSTILWGMNLASSSLLQELNEETWDSQRMSGISPCVMLLGKLFGGTLFAWYCAIFSLGTLLVVTLMEGNFSLISFLSLILIAIVAHTISLSSALALWSKNGHVMSKSIRGALFLPIILFVIVFMSLFRFLDSLMFRGDGSLQQYWIEWFGIHMQSRYFLLLSLFFVLVWLLIALWQQIRSALQYRNKPWYWLFCLVFWIVFFAGLVGSSDIQYVFRQRLKIDFWVLYFYISFLVVLVTVYFQLFFYRKNAMTFLRFSQVIKQKNRNKILDQFPHWMTSYIVAIILALLVLTLCLFGQGARFSFYAIYMLAILLFVLRDIAIFVWFGLSNNKRSGDGAALLCLVLLYFVLPNFLTFIDARELLAPRVLYSILINEGMKAWYVVSPLVQAALMWFLVRNRWQRLRQGGAR